MFRYTMFSILFSLTLTQIKRYGIRLASLLMSEVHSADKLSVARDQWKQHLLLYLSYPEYAPITFLYWCCWCIYSNIFSGSECRRRKGHLWETKQLNLISCLAFPYLLRKVCTHKYESMTSFVRGDEKDFD